MIPWSISVQAYALHGSAVLDRDFQLLGLTTEDFRHLIMAEADILLVQEWPSLAAVLRVEPLD